MVNKIACLIHFCRRPAIANSLCLLLIQKLDIDIIFLHVHLHQVLDELIILRSMMKIDASAVAEGPGSESNDVCFHD